MANQNQRKSFIIHIDSLSVLKKLKDEQAGKLFKAIALFQEEGALPDDELISIIFEPFLNQFLRDSEKYQNIIERNKLNGSKGGRPKNPVGYLVTQENPEKPRKADSDSKNDNVSDSDSKNDLKSNFESFWNLYNKKTARADVEKKFKAALKKDTLENIMQGLEKYIRTRGSDPKFWKNPSTWLNQECWKDEYEAKQQPQPFSKDSGSYLDFLTGGKNGSN